MRPDMDTLYLPNLFTLDGNIYGQQGHPKRTVGRVGMNQHFIRTMKTGFNPETLVRNMRKFAHCTLWRGAAIGSEWKHSKIKCTKFKMTNV